MKKMTALLLTLCMLFSTACFTVSAADWQAGGSVDLRVGVIGDSHISSSANAGWLAKAIQAYLAIGQNQLDGLALTGDIVYQEDSLTEEPYDVLLGLLNGTDSATAGTGIADIPLMYAMGNHGYLLSDRTEEKAQEARQLFLDKMGGRLGVNELKYVKQLGSDDNTYTFIAAAADNYLGFAGGDSVGETEQFLMDEIDKALAADSTNDANGTFAEGVIPDSQKPVFVMLHHPIDGTIFNVETENYSDAFVSFLKNRPQVIVLSAHQHVAAQLPQTIWQDGFTVFQTSHLSNGGLTYYEADNKQLTGDSHQSAMIEVTDNVVKIYKLDHATNSYIGDPWVIDIPKIVSDRTDANSENDNDHYLYSADKRENAENPSFPSGSAVTVSVDVNNAAITWANNAVPGAETPNQQDDFVRGYKLEIKTAAGDAVVSEKLQGDFYKAVQPESYTKTYSLAYNTSYTVSIYPWGVFGGFGAPITKTFKTEKEQVPEGAVRYEFEDFAPAGDWSRLEAASGGAIAIDTWTSSDPSFTVPVKLEKAGYYDITYLAGNYNNNLANLSLVTLTLDGQEIGKNDMGFTEILSAYTSFASAPMSKYEKKGFWLEAGDHTLHVAIAACTSNTSLWKYQMDYIQFTPMENYITQRTGTTRLEAKTIAPQNRFGSGDELLAGLYTGSNGREYVIYSYAPQDPSFTVPVEIKQSGYYDIAYALGEQTSANPYLSEVTLTLGTTEIGKNDTASARTTLTGYDVWNSGETMPMCRYEKKNIWLEAGVYPLNVTVAACTTGDAVYKYQFDYIEFTSKTAVISESGASRLEAEDYVPAADVYATGMADVASGGKIAWNTWTEKDPSFTTSVAFDKTGYYDVAYVVGYQNNNASVNEVKISLGDIEIGDNTKAPTESLASTYGTWSDTLPMGRYDRKGIWIEEGVYKLKVDIPYVDGGEHDHLWKYQMDYIEFSRQAGTVIATDGTATKIEAEDYADSADVFIKNDSVDISQVASGGKIAFGYRYSDPSFTASVEIAKTGFYDVTYLAGHYGDSSYLSLMTITLGDTVIGTNNESSRKTLSAYTSFTSAPMSQYDKTDLWLEKGVYQLKVDIDKCYYQEGTYDVWKYQMDYIAFTYQPGKAVSGTGVTTIEAEDYFTDPGTYGTGAVFEDSYASGGKIVKCEWATKDQSFTVCVEIEEDGDYDVSYIAGYKKGGVSVVTISLGDTVIGANDTTYVKQLTGKYTNDWAEHSPLSLYEKTLRLKKGVYQLKVNISDVGDSVWKYLLDYIRFAPAESSVRVNGGKINAVARYEEHLDSGTALMVLYNEGRLVSTAAAEVKNTNAVAFDVTCDKSFDSIKVFTWNSMNEMKPLCKPVVLQ